MNPPGPELVQRTEDVFRSLATDDFASVKAQMSFICARILTKKKVMRVWHDVTTRSGQWKFCSDTRIENSDGGGSVGQTHLNHEAGQWLGKVAYNGAGKITGLLMIHPSEDENAPF